MSFECCNCLWTEYTEFLRHRIMFMWLAVATNIRECGPSKHCSVYQPPQPANHWKMPHRQIAVAHAQHADNACTCNPVLVIVPSPIHAGAPTSGSTVGMCVRATHQNIRLTFNLITVSYFVLYIIRITYVSYIIMPFIFRAYGSVCSPFTCEVSTQTK